MGRAFFSVHSVNILRRSKVKDSIGAPAGRNGIAYLSAVPCRVGQVDTASAIEYGRLGLTQVQRFYFDSDTTYADPLLIDQIVSDGTTYDVKRVVKAPVLRHWEIDAVAMAGVQ